MLPLLRNLDSPSYLRHLRYLKLILDSSSKGRAIQKEVNAKAKPDERGQRKNGEKPV